LKRLLREPLLHFLLLGAALFAIYEYRQRGAGGAEPAYQITLTSNDVQQLATAFEAQQHRPPSSAELNSLVENKVAEEVLYREALAMGLDKDDTVVKARMAEKMQFLGEDVSGVHEPTTAELKAWFDKHTDQFATPSRASFRHLYFSTDRRGQAALGDAEKALPKLASESKDSKVASSLADSFMFQDYYTDYPLEELTNEFGPQFAPALAKLKPGSWQGPIESTHGWHLVFLDTITPTRTPEFAEIESEVKTAWLADEREQAWRNAYEAMRAKYSVALPPPAAKQAAKTPTQEQP